MDWLSLTILCAIAVAAADALTKKYLADYSTTEILLVRFGFSAVLLAPLLLYAGVPELSPAFLLIVAIMLPFEILGMLLYMKAIRDYPLSLTLPYLAFTPVIITLFAFLFLGETVSMAGFIGILLVIGGSYLLNFEEQHFKATAVLAPFRVALANRGSQLMMIVACIYSLTAVLGKAALDYVPPLFFAGFYFTALGLASLLVIATTNRGAIGGTLKHPTGALLVAGCMVIMIITHFAALNLVETAYMIAVKRTSLLFGILFGAWLFRETHLSRHLLAGSLMVLGVFFIYYG